MSKKIFFIILTIIILLSAIFTVFFFLSKTSVRKKDSVESVKQNIKYAKNINVAEQVIRQTYGEPDERIGSGIDIKVWHLEEGDLFCGMSVWFKDKSGKELKLIQTRNTISENIYGDYEVSIPMSEGTFYIGTLTLSPEGNYKFSQKNTTSYTTANYQDNLLFKNPIGKFQIKLEEGIRMSSVIEEISSSEESKTIALIKFYSEDLSSSFEQQIRFDGEKLLFHSLDSKIETIYFIKQLKNIFYTE